MVKILILGGGFGGIRTALDLNQKLGEEAQITLIDRNNYHLFVPAIYEVASAYGIKKDPFSAQLRKTICIPYADIFQETSVNFIQAEIAEVNIREKRIKTKGEYAAYYDYLVIAMGSEVSDYNIPGVKEYAHQFKNLEDALFINQKLDELSKQFTEGHRIEPFSFLICGGGFTGLELAAELGCCSRVIKSRCKLRGRCSTITLFEAGPKILPVVSDQQRRLIKERLTYLGIMIMENSPIEEVGSNFIKLKSGQKVGGDLVIWTAGIKSNSFLNTVSGLSLSSRGKVSVENSMLVKGFKNIFAIGDNAEFIDPKTQKAIPTLAYVASDQGKIAATNINNLIKNKRLKKYRPFYNATVVPIGGKYAFANIGWITINGFFGWLIRAVIDIRYFLSILTPHKAFKLYLNEISVFLRND